ncbi:MAG: DNA translocase FtsK [Planctomycetota bacterium]|nr:DNA translocase FtsK [Planctomycetota bacterium]
MLERDIKKDLFALALGAVVVFLAISLLTYHPNDKIEPLMSPFNRLYQADVLEYPQSTYVQNTCGRLGALAADWLFSTVGFGAYYVLASLLLLDLSLLKRNQIDSPALRIGGWLVSCLGVCTCLALAIPTVSPGPIFGSGGAVGVMCGAALSSSFATTGGLIIALSMVVGGMLLATDYMVVGVLKTSITAIGKGVRMLIFSPLRFLWQHRPTGLPRSTSKILDVVDVDFMDSPASAGLDATHPELEVHISGRPASPDAPEHWESDLPDQMQDEDIPEPAVVEVKTKRQRKKLPRPQFRIRRKKQKAARQTTITPEQNERERLMQSLEQASRDADQFAEYELPSSQLLDNRIGIDFDSQEQQIRKNARVLEKTFLEFGFDVRVVDVETGPVIAQYEVALAAGLRLSKITGLADDLAIALRVPSVRIVAPIPGKNTVGIEIPNGEQQLVRMREVIEDSQAKVDQMNIPIFLGKDVSGNPLAVDLTKMPHLLIAGRTGSGKSVCLHTIVSSILMSRKPDEVRLLMIDPKMVELSVYGQLPHLMHPVVTDMKKAEAILAWAVEKMEERYRLLARTKVRHITNFNELSAEEIRERLGTSIAQMDEVPTHMPFIVIVADELADLMMTAGKDAEQHIIRLAQKSRAVGIHLILATQKPTVDVITGLIKSNLPARLAFQVASRVDSRVVLDESGAEKLLGNGDMLFLWPGTSTLIRGQGTFLSDDEIQSVVDQCAQVEQNFDHELLTLQVKQEGDLDPSALRKRDELYESAIEVVLREGRGSCSLLQRALGIGYGRAARLVDYMAEDGIVGEHNGSSAREVLLTLEEWDLMQNAETQQDNGVAGITNEFHDALDEDVIADDPLAEVDDDDEFAGYEGDVIYDEDDSHGVEEERFHVITETDDAPVSIPLGSSKRKSAVVDTIVIEDDEGLWNDGDEDAWADELDAEFEE